MGRNHISPAKRGICDFAPSIEPLIAFEATIKLHTVNPYVLVSAAQAHTLRPGWRRPMPVLVQVNGLPDPPWRINMMPTGDGDFYLYLHGTVRASTATQVGDVVRVVVAFDEDYRGGPDAVGQRAIAERLKSNEAALRHWTALSASRQKEVVRYIGRLKSEDARVRNLDTLQRVLAGSGERFLGRFWTAPSPE
jgi:hypothetical protein